MGVRSMEQRNGLWANVLLFLALITIGLGIGWLIGLSISPVVSIVIASVTGSAAAIIATLSGAQDREDKSDGERSHPIPSITPWPLAFLIIGIVIGSIVGMMARNQNWLGSDLSFEINMWTDMGLEREKVVQTLFEKKYAPNSEALKNGGGGTNGTTPYTGTFLFAITADECKNLLFLTGPNELRETMADSHDDKVKKLSEIEADPDIMTEVIRVLCE